MGATGTQPLTRVLLVDSDPGERDALRQLLSTAGYAAEIASTGQEALARVTEDPPHVVVLRHPLSDLSGMEVCRLIKAAQPTLPVLMLVAGQKRNRLAALRAGANDILSYPTDAELLLAQLAILSRLRQAELAAQRRADEASRLLALTHILIPEPDAQAMLRRAAEAAQLLVPSEAASVALVRGLRWQLIGLQTLAEWHDLDLAGTLAMGTHGWVARHRRPLHVSNGADQVLRQALADKLALRSALMVPVVSRDGEVRAVLALYNRRGQPRFGAEDARLVLEVARQAALALTGSLQQPASQSIGPILLPSLGSDLDMNA